MIKTMTNFDIGDIAVYSFDGEMVGNHYLILDDLGDNWLTLVIERSEVTLFRKGNVESLCIKAA